MIRGLKFRRRNVADRLEKPAMVEPVDPFQRRVLNGLEIPPWTAAMNDGTLLGPYRLREEALRAEVKYLEAKLFGQEKA